MAMTADMKPAKAIMERGSRFVMRQEGEVDGTR